MEIRTLVVWLSLTLMNSKGFNTYKLGELYDAKRKDRDFVYSLNDRNKFNHS